MPHNIIPLKTSTTCMKIDKIVIKNVISQVGKGQFRYYILSDVPVQTRFKNRMSGVSLLAEKVITTRVGDICQASAETTTDMD